MPKKFTTLFAAAFMSLMVNVGTVTAGDEADAMEGLVTGVLRGIPKCGLPEIRGICTNVKNFGEAKIRHRLPVAFVEVVNYPMDSALLGSMTGGMQEMSSTRVGDSRHSSSTAHEVRIWLIPDKYRNYLSAGLSKCMWCNDRQAQTKAPSGYAGIGGRKGKSLDSAADALSWLLGCTPVNSGLERAMNQVQKQMSESPFPLGYSSELDAVGWRQGCRDALAGMIYSGVALPMCGGWGVVSTTGTAASSGIQAAGEQTNVDALANNAVLRDILDNTRGSVNKGNACLGDWGTAYPRVYRVEGANPVIGAVTLAWRGLSIARTEVESLKFDVSTRGSLQQIYPEVSDECFRIGAPVSEVQSKVEQGDDGRYMFIYWAEVGCCYEGLNAMACYYNYMGGSAMEGAGEAMEGLQQIQDFQNMFSDMPSVDDLLGPLKEGVSNDVNEWWDGVGEETEAGEDGGDGG